MGLRTFKALVGNRDGMGIIQLIILLSFMGTFAVLMSQVITKSEKSYQNSQAKSSFENLDNMLRSIIAMSSSDASSNACLTIFKGPGTSTAPTVLAGTTTLSKLYYPDGSLALEVNKRDSSGLGQITGMTLTPKSGTTCNASSTCVLDLTISGSTSTSSQVLKPIAISFSASLNASRVMTGCSYKASSNVPIGNLILIRSGHSDSFTNNYQSPVTIRAIVQGPGGGGTQGGADCYGNDGGYNGGNGAYFDGEFQLTPGQQIHVNVGLRGKDGGAAEWGRDSTISVFNSVGSVVTNVIVMGGRAYSSFRGFDPSYPYIFNDTPASFVCYHWQPTWPPGFFDYMLAPQLVRNHPCAGSNNTVAQVWIQTGSVTRIIESVNGTACDTATVNSRYNQNPTFAEALGNFNSKATITQMFDYRAYGTSNDVPAGYGNGGRAGWSGTDHLQTPGQNGIGILYVKSSP